MMPYFAATAKFAILIVAYWLTFMVVSTKPNSSCYTRWQQEINCVLQEGRWEVGQTMNYTYYPSLIKPTIKDDWSICKHRIMPYVWRSNRECSASTIKPTYSQDEICSIMGGRNLMIVGDSINNEFFVTFSSAAWLPGIPMVPANIVHLDSFIRYDIEGKKIGMLCMKFSNSVSFNVLCFLSRSLL